MAPATELTHLSPDCLIWQAYDPTVKAELFSTALRHESGFVVVDPIPLADDARQELEALGKIETVLITNANHARAARAFGDETATFVPAELRHQFPQACVLHDGEPIAALTALAIEGAAPGEFAFHQRRAGGTLVVGDALINFEPHGFTLLPAKYCTDHKQMVSSLRRLLDLQFTRLFFAHGCPVLTRAHERLAALLDEC